MCPVEAPEHVGGHADGIVGIGAPVGVIRELVEQGRDITRRGRRMLRPRDLDVSYRTLQRRIKRYDLEGYPRLR